jgi:hypothetical protein
LDERCGAAQPIAASLNIGRRRKASDPSQRSPWPFDTQGMKPDLSQLPPLSHDESEEFQMPIDHIAHAPAAWKTLAVIAMSVFIMFMIIWKLYLANSGAAAQLSSQ